jgi:hypothetical protein
MRVRRKKARPEIYAAARGKEGWKLSRRRFFTGVLGASSLIMGAKRPTGARAGEPDAQSREILGLTCKEVAADTETIGPLATIKDGTLLLTTSSSQNVKVWSV